jgi:hypothetical protein
MGKRPQDCIADLEADYRPSQEIVLSRLYSDFMMKYRWLYLMTFKARC